MPYAEMGGSAVVAPAELMFIVVGVGKPGGALPGAPVPPCSCAMMMGAVGACVVATCGSDIGRRGAASPAAIVAGGTWVVVAVELATGSVIITCCSEMACGAPG